MTKFSSSDFIKSTSDKAHNLGIPHTSGSKKIMKLKSDIAGYSRESKWIVKENQFSWVVNEYVASKLYQSVLGSHDISDSALVHNAEDPKKLSLAIKLMDNYATDFIPFTITTSKAKDFPFICVLKVCSIESKASTTALSTSVYKNKPVSGYEMASIASRLFVDQDTNDGNNYALKIGSDSVHVTRYDFDDSLKFFQYDSITEEELSPEILDLIERSGRGIEFYNTLSQQMSMKYYEMSWYDYFYTGGESSKKVWSYFNAEKFTAALEYFINLDRDVIHSVLRKSFDEVKEVVGDSTFSEHYDFNKLEAISQCDDCLTDADKLAEYAFQVISKRFDALDDMLKCLKVEAALKENNKTALIETLEQFTPYNLMSIECQSFYNLHKTSFNIKTDIAGFADIYNNEASQYLPEHVIYSAYDEL